MSRLPTVLRRLQEEDALLFSALLATDPWRWDTVRTNIEGYGFRHDTVTFWGAFSANETALRGVLMRFSNTVVVVDAGGECARLFAEMIDAEVGVMGIRGTAETVTALCPHLHKYQISSHEESLYMALRQPPLYQSPALPLARPALASDLERMVALYAVAGTMYRSRANLQPKIGRERAFVVEEEATRFRPARIVSSALMNVEGKAAGMIGGVFTLPEARGKGYAAACVTALSLDLQRDGKCPTLFYENPVAGRVYTRIGFEGVGRWRLLFLVPKKGAQRL